MILKNREQFLNEDESNEVTLEDIYKLPEYKKIIDLGFTDISTKIQNKHMNFVFIYKGSFYMTSSKFSKLFGDTELTPSEEGEKLCNAIRNIPKVKRYLSPETTDITLLDRYAKDNIFLYSYSITKSGYIRLSSAYPSMLQSKPVPLENTTERKTIEDWINGFSKLISILKDTKMNYNLK